MRNLVLVAALAAAGAVAGAGAAPAQQSKAVYYGDLNLRSESGVQRLDRRIAAAAGQVCQDRPGSVLARTHAARKCRRDTLGRTAARRDAAVERAQAVAVATR